MNRWKTEAHFVSSLGLCPDNRISGDKVLARGTRHVLNRAATALRLGASTLLRSQTYLGAQYRRLRSKLGAPKAITAMAHRLARLVYRMLKYGQQYVDKGAEYYERRNRQQQIEFVRKKAAQLGLQVTPPMSETINQEVSGASGYRTSGESKTPDVFVSRLSIVANRSLVRIGLETYPSIPAARHRS